VVERTIAWVHADRRLQVRYDRRADIHQVFLTLAGIKVCGCVLFDGYCWGLLVPYVHLHHWRSVDGQTLTEVERWDAKGVVATGAAVGIIWGGVTFGRRRRPRPAE
jgi:hypothetical protein